MEVSTKVRFEGLRWAWRTVLTNDYGLAITGAALLIADILLSIYAFQLVERADEVTYSASGDYFNPITVAFIMVLAMSIVVGLAAVFGPVLVQLRRKGTRSAVKVLCLQIALLILATAGLLYYVSHRSSPKSQSPYNQYPYACNQGLC